MASRNEVAIQLSTRTDAYEVTLISNPTVDDVMVFQMKMQAASLINQDSVAKNFKVDKNIRGLLVRLGVSNE